MSGLLDIGGKLSTIPLHRNKSSGQKSLNLSGKDQSCFVKENYHLSNERCTVMIIAFSANQIKTPSLEFVFEGKGKRVKFEVKFHYRMG